MIFVSVDAVAVDAGVSFAVGAGVAFAVDAGVAFAAFFAVNPGGSFIFLLVGVGAGAEDADEAFFVVDEEADDDDAVGVLLPFLRLTLRLDFLFFGMLLLFCQLLNYSVLFILVFIILVLFVILVLFIILVLVLLCCFRILNPNR